VRHLRNYLNAIAPSCSLRDIRGGGQDYVTSAPNAAFADLVNLESLSIAFDSRSVQIDRTLEGTSKLKELFLSAVAQYDLPAILAVTKSHPGKFKLNFASPLASEVNRSARIRRILELRRKKGL
jgi:hypothetical protein